MVLQIVVDEDGELVLTNDGVFPKNKEQARDRAQVLERAVLQFARTGGSGNHTDALPDLNFFGGILGESLYIFYRWAFSKDVPEEVMSLILSLDCLRDFPDVDDDGGFGFCKLSDGETYAVRYILTSLINYIWNVIRMGGWFGGYKLGVKVKAGKYEWYLRMKAKKEYGPFDLRNMNEKTVLELFKQF